MVYIYIGRASSESHAGHCITPHQYKFKKYLYELRSWHVRRARASRARCSESHAI